MQVKYAFPSWNEIEEECRIVSKKIRESSYTPEIVVALSRGGLVPARIICDMLVIKDLITVKVDHWGITAAKDGEAKLRFPVDVDLSGRRVLIVDDITDTGESLSLAADWVRKKNPKEIKTAVIYHIDHSKVVPDFYSRKIDHKNWTWFVWPWNFVEDACNILQKELDGKSASTTELKKSFEKNHGAKISDGQFIQVLDELEHIKVIRRNPDDTWQKV